MRWWWLVVLAGCAVVPMRRSAPAPDAAEVAQRARAARLDDALQECRGDVDGLEAQVVSLIEELAALEARKTSRPGPSPRHAGIEPLDGTWVLTGDLRDDLVNVDNAATWNHGRALLHRGEDGTIDGYRLSGIRRDSQATALGLRNGDIVHEVAGHPLDGVQGAMRAWNAVRDAEAFTVRVTRRGHPVLLRYQVR